MANREFNFGEPLGYFITWTTYGTWLPGDERGWVAWGNGEQTGDDEIRRESELSLKERPFLMTHADRRCVESTVQRHCVIRNWDLHAVSARSNHVHVVATAPDYAPEIVRDQFKAWTSRKLKERHPQRERFWTEGASCRWLNHQDELENAVRYTLDAQDRKVRDAY